MLLFHFFSLFICSVFCVAGWVDFKTYALVYNVAKLYYAPSPSFSATVSFLWLLFLFPVSYLLYKRSKLLLGWFIAGGFMVLLGKILNLIGF